MTRIAIVQSNYIPWRGYFALIAAVDRFVSTICQRRVSARRIGNDWALDFLRWVQRGALQLDVPAEG